MTRAEAIGHLLGKYVVVHEGNEYEKELNEALAPAIEALSERTGEWILECDSEGEGDNLYRCSKCGCKYGCQEYDKPNFCLDCGAYMRIEVT